MSKADRTPQVRGAGVFGALQLVFGVRPAPDSAGAEGGLQPGDVGGSAEGGIHLYGTGEGGPRLAAVAGVNEFCSGCLQRLRAQ
jgi:hypothetical protein